MIWGTVSSRSCFCWLYRASPCSAAENIISLITVLTMVLTMCGVIACVVARECLLWPVRSLGKTLLAFALLHFVLQDQTCLLFQVSLDFLLLHSSPLWWKGYLFWVLVLEDFVSLYRTIQLQLLWLYWSGHRLRLPLYLLVCLGKWIEIILLFLRSHLSTAFQNLLLTLMATAFLLRDSCLQ